LFIVGYRKPRWKRGGKRKKTRKKTPKVHIKGLYEIRENMQRTPTRKEERRCKKVGPMGWDDTCFLAEISRKTDRKRERRGGGLKKGARDPSTQKSFHSEPNGGKVLTKGESHI